MTTAAASARDEASELRDTLADLKIDRDNLLIKNHEMTRKYEHEVGRLNTIIANYRAEIIRLGGEQK